MHDRNDREAFSIGSRLNEVVDDRVGIAEAQPQRDRMQPCLVCLPRNQLKLVVTNWMCFLNFAFILCIALPGLARLGQEWIEAWVHQFQDIFNFYLNSYI